MSISGKPYLSSLQSVILLGGFSSLQCLWSVLQGPWEGEANRAEEGQYPDQEEETVQDQDSISL